MRGRIRRSTAVVAAALLAAIVGCATPAAGPAPEQTAPYPEPPAAGGEAPARGVVPERPNIVLVLMDDFSLDLLPTMASVREMRRRGAAYEHAYVVDSLCCVSRASLLTGQYPHQTGVLTNTANLPNPVGPLGGWEAFAEYDNTRRSVNVQLQRSGYTTGFIGKYLNQYEVSATGQVPSPPPGWSDWQPILGNAYNGWDFDRIRVRDGRPGLRHHEAPSATASDAEKDAAYVGTVVADRTSRFVRQHRDDQAPYFLTVAPFGVHSRVGPAPHYPGDPGFPSAMRDRAGAGNCGLLACSELGRADLPGLGDDQSDNVSHREDGSVAGTWRTHVPTLTREAAVRSLRERARMAQSIDRMVLSILRSVGPDTYVVLTSDNGFHLGQHGLDRGKGTPFDSDVHVPLVVVGPGVEPGSRVEVVSNLDLAPTFEDLAGLDRPAYRSGRSLVPTFGDPRLSRRNFTFFEHTYAPSLGSDPDGAYAGGTLDLIPSYVAVRSRDALLVRFDLDPDWEGVDHAWEFYDYRRVGWERTNEYAAPEHRARISLLTRKLEAFDGCVGITRGASVPTRCRRLTQ